VQIYAFFRKQRRIASLFLFRIANYHDYHVPKERLLFIKVEIIMFIPLSVRGGITRHNTLGCSQFIDDFQLENRLHIEAEDTVFPKIFGFIYLPLMVLQCGTIRG
jgi:hypothetical protein